MSAISRDDTKDDGTSTCQLITVGCSGGKQKMESDSVFGGASKRRRKGFTDKKTIYGVTIILALANLQLLIYSCLLLKANHTLKTDWIGTWCILVLIKSFLNIMLGIYFIWEYGRDPEKRIANFRLGVLLSGIFFFWPTVNVGLFIMVFKRYRDITNSRSTTSRADSPLAHDDSQPPPYSPGPYITPRQQSQVIDPAPVTGWSHQPLLNFDGEERLLSP
ncbi:hypothetical protein AVEN_307-1 [Araneus ventricosus]|uniref:Uncharacterized protein n=1 Tax=Araneus ventricosus TaxID=182803 RepID=A0A4Y2I4U9_ARAVE|nr:hypothetical protein AVEN_307-1 [Araneus ventricosus]